MFQFFFIPLCFSVDVCTISVDPNAQRSHDRSVCVLLRSVGRFAPAHALTDVLRPDVAYVTVSQCDYGLDLPFVQNVVDLSAGGYGSDRVPLLIGANSVAKTHIAETIQKGLVPVYVYDDVPWEPYKCVVEKPGHVLSMIDLELFLKNLSSFSIAEWKRRRHWQSK